MSKNQKYIFNDIKSVTVHGKSQEIVLDVSIFKNALDLTNKNINILKENAPDLFGILGMRNLSAFIGEMFVSSLEKCSSGLLIKNPHQDGYPDLLIMTDEGKDLWKKLEKNNQDKNPFSGFDTGGIEVKATCGSVPTPAQFREMTQLTLFPFDFYLTVCS